MADTTDGTEPEVTDGGAAGPHPDRPRLVVLAGPSTNGQTNTLQPGLCPVACLKIDNVRFDFDSSLLLTDVRLEMPLLKTLLEQHEEAGATPDAPSREPPLAIFGHADPEGSDDYNKALSGRRAAVVYGLLTRRTEIWEDIYSNTGKFAAVASGDKWGVRAIQIMLNGLPVNLMVDPQPDPLVVDGQMGPATKDAVKRFQTDHGLAVDGDPGPDTRKALFKAYMDYLCIDDRGNPYQVDVTDGFLGHNADPNGKVDYQGCGEFNPVFLFSQSELDAYDKNQDHAERDEANRINRRVMILLFRPSVKVNTALWPCPTAKEGVTGCRKRFWSDGDKRRGNSDVERNFVDTKDTFACRFYQRITTDSPCENAPRVANKCKMVNVKGTLKLSAAELGAPDGATYAWSTTSSKIGLNGSDQETVTVQAFDNPSDDLGDETVTLTATGATSVVRTVKITVVQLLFSPSPKQRYGYDDFDTPDNPADDHICIKNSDFTLVHVDIAGGALGTDFDFVCDDNATCTVGAPEAKASFDLRLNAGAMNKGHTTLRAKIKCPKSPALFGQLEVHVYKERVVNVVVAKIDNPNTTFLRFPTADYAAHAVPANEKLKEGVVHYNIANYDPDNKITPVTYASGTGVVSFDINANGGADLIAIQKAMKGVAATAVRVAIIRGMKSYYYLSKAAAVGDTTLTLRGGATFFKAGKTPPLGTGATLETITIVSVAGGVITCAPLTKAHPVGEMLEFPAAGWSSDPILIMEGNSPLDVAKWTVLHEVGHRPLGLQLADIVDQTDFMNYSQDWTDHRLRFCPRTKQYDPAPGTGPTENQWELIPRT